MDAVVANELLTAFNTYDAVVARDAVFAQLLVMLYSEPEVNVVPPPPPAEFNA